MVITKQQLMKLVRDLPARVDVDDFIYRLYLRLKLESAERDVRAGRLLPHSKVVEQTAKWFK